MSDIQQLAANTIRALSMDGVQAANSGHPGAPMGMAELATVLWSNYLTVDPADPEWPDRDRFVLSNGHGSMLIYSMLHLAGFPLPIEQLQSFRQWGSLTAGHPEYEPHVGIEMTTGPLGQGFGTAVGMAIAEEHLRATLGADLVDHRTWAFVSDGDLMEGISYETASLAGHLGLGKLIYVYDDNEISIDGSTDIAFTEHVPDRFTAAGWHVLEVDGHDLAAIDEVYAAAVAEEAKPSLVVAHTVIGRGAPTKAGSAKAHGAPLGPDEIAGWRASVEWPDVDFHVPAEVRDFFTQSMARGAAARSAWAERHAAAMADTERAAAWNAHYAPDDVVLDDPGFEIGEKLATRAAMGKLFDQIAHKAPSFIGGAADLVESTKTEISFSGGFSTTDRTGRNIHYGIREHAMGTITNGLALHGGLKPYGATFFMFSDYMRPAVRLSALMQIPSIWVYTHESVFLGEDGPTHQPVEHFASLRAMPGLTVIRPADAGEMLEAWEHAINNTAGPVLIAGTRQGLPVLDRSDATGDVARGGYVLREGTDAVFVATGSEVSLALEAAEALAATHSIRVVSLPSWELFFAQDPSYQDEVLPPDMPTASIEAGTTFGWERIVGDGGLMIGIDRFGASAPASRIAEEFGFTVESVVAAAEEWLGLE